MIKRNPAHSTKSRTVRLICVRLRTLSNLRLAVTSAQVRKQLAEEERAAAKLGEIYAHDVSPSTFIHVGLELEEYQYV
jgi:hypothetical protein